MGYLTNHDFEICAPMIGQNTSKGGITGKNVKSRNTCFNFLLFSTVFYEQQQYLTTAATCSPDSVHFFDVLKNNISVINLS